MLMLTAAAQNTQPDYVALAMVAALALVVVIMAIRKKMSRKTVSEPVAAEAPETAAAPGSAGQIKLHNVEPRTAAMVMAIVAEKTGKPLNELRFISIKEVQ